MDALNTIALSVIAGLIVAGVLFFVNRRARSGHGISVPGHHNVFIGRFTVNQGSVVAGVMRLFRIGRFRWGHGISVPGHHNTIVGPITINQQGRVHIGNDPPKDPPKS